MEKFAFSFTIDINKGNWLQELVKIEAIMISWQIISPFFFKLIAEIADLQKLLYFISDHPILSTKYFARKYAQRITG